MQADPRNRAIPVIVISADAMGSQADRVRAAGATAYISKPIDLEEFLEVLMETLRAGQALGAGHIEHRSSHWNTLFASLQKFNALSLHTRKIEEIPPVQFYLLHAEKAITIIPESFSMGVN